MSSHSLLFAFQHLAILAMIMTDQQSFLVTARKWRPLRFADVVGQEHVTTTLKNAIRSGRIHHAYLFTGPRGVGKTTCARILARAVNCQFSVDTEPCNVCNTCRDVLDGRSVDVIEIDGASNNSVDDVRKLRENAKYAPMSGRYRMYIIDEVHMLSTAAFNALLKTLEEPPPHLVFVFATTEIHKVPATILSRCQRFDFRRMEIDSIVEHIAHIAAAESITIDDESLVSVAKKADGSMRDAQSIFDQLVSFCGTDITYLDVANALHLIDLDFFFAVSNAARTHDVARMFELARQVIAGGHDVQECLVGLLEHYRNILTVITTGSTSLIEASSAFLDKYTNEASLNTKADVLRIMTLISAGEAVLRQNPPQPRVRFEFTLVQLAAMDSTVDLGQLLSRISATPTSGPVGGTSMAVKLGNPMLMRPVTIKGASKVKASTAAVNALSSLNLAERWNQVVEQLPEHLAFVKSAIKQQMLTVEFNEVSIILQPTAEIIAHRIEDKRAMLREHLTAVYGAPVGVQLLPCKTKVQGQVKDVEDSQSVVSEELLPIEQTLIELFKARRV